MSFSYQITQKNSVIIVVLTGAITRDNLAVLERLQTEIAEREFSWVVLHFNDAEHKTDQIALPHLARIQKSVRDKGGQVRVSSLRPQLRQLLLERGLLRAEEYVEDLAQTLKQLARVA
jgi:anti-anti-sigma regulatory factor